MILKKCLSGAVAAVVLGAAVLAPGGHAGNRWYDGGRMSSGWCASCY